jgi:hypothetical protein
VKLNLKCLYLCKTNHLIFDRTNFVKMNEQDGLKTHLDFNKNTLVINTLHAVKNRSKNLTLHTSPNLQGLQSDINRCLFK